MNFKRVAIAAGSAGLLLASAVPAFASVNTGVLNGNVIQSNNGYQVTSVRTSASTGGNANHAWVAGVQGVTSGNAVSSANVQNQLNYNQISCGCVGGSFNLGLGNGNTVQLNKGSQFTSVSTSARTGGNHNGAAVAGFQHVGSGAAASGAVVVNAVNTNIIGN